MANFEPLAMWQQMISQWERQINDFYARLGASEHFAGSLNQAGKVTLAARQTFDGAMEKLLQTLQMSTGAQIAAVSERLDRIEETLARIERAGAAAEIASPAEPRRTRTPDDAT